MSSRTYLVGGAVRDRLLGLDPSEQDWVVTGSTPAAMKAAGYRQVGSSFPVFLHPRTGEEYALARTERKQGHGYHGFDVDFDPGVTLEQDLQRRDLTINAMAIDDDGNLVDPWGGQADLESGVLRHVSPAFSEDPLRVLRVARFAARFASRGFTVHPETMALMQSLSRSGELEHLVAERSWQEIRRAMETPKPGVFVDVLRECGALAALIPELDRLFGVPQNPEWHPEIDTGLHTGMSMDWAASAGAGSDIVFAVMLHDLGKGLTPEDQWPMHRGHESAGLPLVEAVCDRFRVPVAVKRLAMQVSAGHLRCHRVGEMRAAKIMALLESLDAFRSGSVQDFTLACHADYCGRTGREDWPYPQAGWLAQALEAALKVRAGDLEPGLQGRAVGEALRRARIAAIKEVAVEFKQ